MALELSTAGVTVSYSVETVSGTRPTTAAVYTTIPNIKSIPELSSTPNSIQVTDLAETGWHQYINGLKDTGGAIEFMANNTDAFQTAWSTFVSAQETGESSDLATWVVIEIPGLANGFYMSGVPSSLGLGSVDVDSVAEVGCSFMPNEVYGWAAVPTT